MRIGIDGNLLCGKKTGMGMSLYNILMHLSISSCNNIILFIQDEIDDKLKNVLLQKKIIIKQIGKKNYFIWEQVILPKYAKKYNIDIFWFPNNTGSIFIKCKIILTINDVIYMHGSIFSPQTIYKKLGMMYRRFIVPKVVKNSGKIIAISDYTKSEIIKCFPSAWDKISTVHLGCNFNENALIGIEWHEFLKEQNISNRYILSFGSLEKRKNTLMSIKAYERLNDKMKNNYNLVLYGFRGWRKSVEHKYIVEHKLKNIIILDYVTNEQLASLYKNAECFLFITLDEGFGLPLLEAMYNQTPVITSNISCLPEIAGNAALYVNPKDEYDIANKIEQLINDSDLGNILVENGLKNIKRFDWENTADKIQELFSR